MAGIREAMNRVIEHRNEGRVLAKGNLKLDDETPTKYLIIKLECDKSLLTVYDYGSDINIKDDINVGDKIALIISSNWSAEWQKFSPHLRINNKAVKVKKPEIVSEQLIGQPA